MDVYCPRCGEPFDAYEVRHEFKTIERIKFWRGAGCPCCINQLTVVPTPQAAATAALRDTLGDDIDAIASMLDDVGFEVEF